MHHYFGSKEKLFLSTVEVPIDLPRVLVGIGADGIDGLGERLIRTILGVWESPAGASIGAALRTALADPARARMLREFLVPQIVGPLLGPLHLPAQEAELRTGLLMTQVLGVITGRYLLAVEPLASLPVDESRRERRRHPAAVPDRAARRADSMTTRLSHGGRPARRAPAGCRPRPGRDPAW